LPTQAWALSTNDLLSTIAMPLAVAAVSNVNGVPQSQLANLVVALNQANVPPTQFVQVIRYVPVALVDQNGQPFIAYVQQETTQDSANVPPLQEIEIIRYAPVALVVDNGQPFVQYVQQQVTQGVTGPALVPVVVQQLQTYYPAQTQIVVNPTPAPTAVAVPVPQPA